MIENNNKLIASKAAPELRQGHTKIPGPAGSKPQTDHQVILTRGRTAKSHVENGQKPLFCDTKNPLKTIPDASKIHAGPDRVMAFELASKYIPMDDVGLKEYAEMCSPICKYVGINHAGQWWETEPLFDEEDKRFVAHKTSKNAAFEKMVVLVQAFLEDLSDSPEFNSYESNAKIQSRICSDVGVFRICAEIMRTM
jgi:hypothetical protein